MESTFVPTGVLQCYCALQLEGERAFRRVLALDPGRAHVHYSLGLLLERCGDPELAKRSYATTVELEHGLEHGGGQGSKAEALVVPSAL